MTADLRARVDAMVSQLRDGASGTHRWYVRHKVDGGVCIWWEDYERQEAYEWWDDHPDRHQEWELVRAHYRDREERLMIDAADLLQELTG